MDVVMQEVKKIAVGMLILDALMLFICRMIGHFTPDVILGVLYSSFVSMISFILLGLSVSRAIHASGKGAAIFMALNYLIRYAFTAVLLYMGLVSFELNTLAVIIPLFFPQLIIYFKGIFLNR